jgi:hypothetical protein
VIAQFLHQKVCSGVGGLLLGWTDVQAILRIAYSNQKIEIEQN